MESRGGLFSSTVFFGLQYFIKEYLTQRITAEDIAYAESRFIAHFGDKVIFNRAGWEHIHRHHDGYLPIRIKAVPEGTVVPIRNVLMTIENTDPEVAWLTNYIETLLLKVWYPTTVATLSREIKKMIAAELDKTGNRAGLPFKLHDFGYRSVSSEESAGIGGLAHLVNFMGSDTMLALEYGLDYYGEHMAGFSIPATEHSIMCSEGEEGEVNVMERFLNTFGQNPNYPAIACVSDTFNVFRASSDYWGGELKHKVEKLNNKVLVVRPDSGTPHVIVMQVVELLDKAFGHAVNDKGYKVLNHVRVIQGDGINYAEIRRILDVLTDRGYSTDNIAFGMGGALLQQLNRDTQSFAIKASSYVIDGRRKDYQKSPITDNGKRSKAGRLKLMRNPDGVLETFSADVPGTDELVTVFENGRLVKEYTLAEIRQRAELPEPIPSFL